MDHNKAIEILKAKGHTVETPPRGTPGGENGRIWVDGVSIPAERLTELAEGKVTLEGLEKGTE
jgi:hypothetical protein